jgi:hypothetical protein
MKTNHLQTTSRATLTYIAHMSWVSGVLLVLGKQEFPWCCFEAAVILLGFRTWEIARDEWKLRTVPAKPSKGLHARRTR